MSEDLAGAVLLTLALVLSVAGAVWEVALTIDHVRRTRAVRELRAARRRVDAFYR